MSADELLAELLAFYDREALMRAEGFDPGKERLTGACRKRIERARKSAGLVEVRGLLLPDIALLRAINRDDGREWSSEEIDAAAKRWVTRCVVPHVTRDNDG